MKELIAVRNKIIVELDITVESKTESDFLYQKQPRDNHKNMVK